MPINIKLESFFWKENKCCILFSGLKVNAVPYGRKVCAIIQDTLLAFRRYNPHPKHLLTTVRRSKQSGPFLLPSVSLWKPRELC